MRPHHRAIMSALVFAFVLPQSSCKKDDSTPVDPPPPPPDASGTWSGSYSDNLGSGTISFTLTQSGSNVSGMYAVTSASGSGRVSGTVSQKNFSGQTIGTAGSCTFTNNLTGSFTGFSQGDSLLAAYTGSNSCTGQTWTGQLKLKKQ